MTQIWLEETSHDAQVPPKDTTHVTNAQGASPQNAHSSPETNQDLQEMSAEAIIFSPTPLPHDIRPGSTEAVEYRMPSYFKTMAEFKRLVELKCQARNFQREGFGRVPLKLLLQLESAIASYRKESYSTLGELLLNVRQNIAARQEEYKKGKEA